MTDLTRIVLVSNPHAGKGRGAKLLPGLVHALRAALPDTELDIHETSTFAHAREQVRHAVARAQDSAEREALMVMGGDGMMTLGVDACAETTVPLGMIPAGTGNDMCRGLGLTGVDPIAAANRVIRGRTTEVDVLRVRGDLTEGDSQRFVGTVVATGYDAMVNRRANAMRLPIGNFRYAAAALGELRVFRPLEYRLVVDGKPRELEAMVVAVGNTPYFGGGMQACPQADPTDGLLDVTIIHPCSRAVLLTLLPTMFNGWYVNLPIVETFRAREVRVEGPEIVPMGDGEVLGPAPMDVDVRPRALKIFG